jgi:hypothetical protein
MCEKFAKICEVCITLFMASFIKSVGYMANCIKKPTVRSGKLSNVGPAGSIPTRVKLLLFKKIFAKKEQKFSNNFCSFFCKKFLKSKSFTLMGIEPTLLNLPDQTVGSFIHFAT